MTAADGHVDVRLDALCVGIDRARRRIAPFIRTTPIIPVLSSPQVSGGPVVLGKAESLQITGSFKARGALNKAIICAEAGISRLVTSSTGNHGAAVAYAGSVLGLACTAYVPAGASQAKVDIMRGFGADIIEVDDPLAGEVRARDRESSETGCAYVSPYNDLDVIAGQGTLGLELLSQCDSPPDVVFVAVGGGGLATGTAAAIRSDWPTSRVVGCHPTASPALLDSLAEGHVVQVDIRPTLSDGTAGNLVADTVTLPLYASLVSDNVLVDEPEIAPAMRRLLLEDHLVVEGAAGLAAAGCLRWRPRPGERAVIILCGGNIAPRTLSGVLSAPAERA